MVKITSTINSVPKPQDKNTDRGGKKMARMMLTILEESMMAVIKVDD